MGFQEREKRWSSVEWEGVAQIALHTPALAWVHEDPMGSRKQELEKELRPPWVASVCLP